MSFKGYFRRGVALAGLGLYEEAAISYLECLSLDPTLTSVKSALAIVSIIYIDEFQLQFFFQLDIGYFKTYVNNSAR